MVKIELVYGSSEKQSQIKLEMATGSTVLDAISTSNILSLYPEINLDTSKIGIFSHFVSLDKILKDQDRIEIYRPLVIDPKQARKLRAKKTLKSEPQT